MRSNNYLLFECEFIGLSTSGFPKFSFIKMLKNSFVLPLEALLGKLNNYRYLNGCQAETNANNLNAYLQAIFRPTNGHSTCVHQFLDEAEHDKMTVIHLRQVANQDKFRKYG